jgi:hypothetical protein
MDAIDGTLAAFSITRLTSSYTYITCLLFISVGGGSGGGGGGHWTVGNADNALFCIYHLAKY